MEWICPDSKQNKPDEWVHVWKVWFFPRDSWDVHLSLFWCVSITWASKIFTFCYQLRRCSAEQIADSYGASQLANKKDQRKKEINVGRLARFREEKSSKNKRLSWAFQSVDSKRNRRGKEGDLWLFEGVKASWNIHLWMRTNCETIATSSSSLAQTLWNCSRKLVSYIHPKECEKAFQYAGDCWRRWWKVVVVPMQTWSIDDKKSVCKPYPLHPQRDFSSI